MPINVSGPNTFKLASGFTTTVEGEVRDAAGALQGDVNVTFGTEYPPGTAGPDCIEFLPRDAFGDTVVRRAAGTTTDRVHGTFRMEIRGKEPGECEIVVRSGPDVARLRVKVEASSLALLPGGAVIKGADGRTYGVPSGAAPAVGPGGAVLLAPRGVQAPGGLNVVIIDI